jgi:hypothetical protein
MFITEWMTRIVEDTQIGDVSEHWRLHTEDGRQNQASVIHSLGLLRGHIGGGRDRADRICLIWDLCRAHMTETVHHTAEELNIELMCIPASCTDELQALSKKSSRAQKAKAKHEHQMELTRREERGKLQACRDMVKVWNELGENVIKSGWAHPMPQYQMEFGDDEDDEDRTHEHEHGQWRGQTSVFTFRASLLA